MPHLTAKLLGQVWEIAFSRLRGRSNGYCYDPAKRRILIHSRLKPRKELEVTLHESLHALDWHKDESWVTQSAAELADLLWRLGYRRDKDQSEI
jgi:hypothetical protein